VVMDAPRNRPRWLVCQNIWALERPRAAARRRAQTSASSSIRKLNQI